MEQAVSSPHDPALLLFLTAPTEADAGRQLEQLLTGPIDNVVRGVIRRTLACQYPAGPSEAVEDARELRNDVMLRLVRRLRELKEDASRHAIADLTAYAATVAYHVCYAYLRRRHPEWARLKNKIRYILTHDPRLRLDAGPGGTWRCSLARWSPTMAIGVLAPKALPDVSAVTFPLQDLVHALLEGAGGPVELVVVVNAAAGVLGIRDAVESGTARHHDGSPLQEIPDPAPPAAAAIDESAHLKQLWREVGELPLRQRLALLLNLRDEQGRGVIALLPLTGTASIRQIAETLDMPAADFARLWSELPIDDRRIAERLGVTRQQVINLRKAARARLARRARVRRAAVSGW